jgi:hypothetical protein
MVQLICTDKGQHPPRDIVEMLDFSRWPPANSAGRWQVRWREAWVRLRRSPHKRTWEPVVPVGGYSGDLARELIEAEVLVFCCPSCRRRPRWRRDHLDELCDRASAEGMYTLDLSRLE